jgi:hypothetical protein
MKRTRLLNDDLPAVESTQDGDFERLGVQSDDRKRAAPDASGGTQDGDAALHV